MAIVLFQVPRYQTAGRINAGAFRSMPFNNKAQCVGL